MSNLQKTNQIYRLQKQATGMGLQGLGSTNKTWLLSQIVGAVTRSDQMINTKTLLIQTNTTSLPSFSEYSSQRNGAGRRQQQIETTKLFSTNLSPFPKWSWGKMLRPRIRVQLSQEDQMAIIGQSGQRWTSSTRPLWRSASPCRSGSPPSCGRRSRSSRSCFRSRMTSGTRRRRSGSLWARRPTSPGCEAGWSTGGWRELRWPIRGQI